MTLVCPRCRGAMVAEACAPCGLRFPTVEGVPVVLEGAAAHLAATYLELGRSSRRARALSRELARAAARSPARGPLLARMSEGARHNAAHFDRLAAPLTAHLGAREVADAALSSAGDAAAGAGGGDDVGYQDVLSYVRRDWSGRPENEEELARIAAAVDAGLAEAPPGPVLVLGAGTARTAHDVARTRPEVVAIERSLSMGLTYAELRRDGAVEHWDLSSSNVRRADDLALRIEARFAAPPSGHRVDYVVADARALPLASASAAAVVSVFFTDVLPLDALLAEVTRVLRPGGVFVHFGPLGYHFDGVADRLGLDEVHARIGAAGFTVRGERHSPGFHLARSWKLGQVWYDAWTFHATLTGAREADPVYARAPGLTLLSTARLGDGGEDELIDARLALPSGRAYAVPEPVLALVRALDGRTPLSAALGALEARFELGEPERRAIGRAMAELSRGGLVVTS